MAPTEENTLGEPYETEDLDELIDTTEKLLEHCSGGGGYTIVKVNEQQQAVIFFLGDEAGQLYALPVDNSFVSSMRENWPNQEEWAPFSMTQK